MPLLLARTFPQDLVSPSLQEEYRSLPCTPGSCMRRERRKSHVSHIPSDQLILTKAAPKAQPAFNQQGCSKYRLAGLTCA